MRSVNELLLVYKQKQGELFHPLYGSWIYESLVTQQALTYDLGEVITTVRDIENRKAPALFITEEDVGGLQFIVAMEKTEHYGGKANTVRFLTWAMRFWFHLMPFVGIFAKEAAQLCPSCHLQFGQSIDMMECLPLDMQGLGMVRL
jgi:hypothetical protein